MFSELATVAGGVIGGIYGGPAGAAVGSSIGGSVGAVEGSPDETQVISQASQGKESTLGKALFGSTTDVGKSTSNLGGIF